MSRRAHGSLSEVARWHLLSGQPENVTDEGQFVAPATALRLQAEKDQLRAEITRLHGAGVPAEAANIARLAASYLLCGDVETAGRYLESAHDVCATRHEE